MTAKQQTKPKPEASKKDAAGEWKPAFLAALSNTANVRAAAQAAGIARKTAYQHKHEDAAFAEAWHEALDDACDLLEATALERARSGSDLLLIFLLKAHRPEKFRENHKIDMTHRRAASVEELTNAELMEIAARGKQE